jgi:hypothetical protein
MSLNLAGLRAEALQRLKDEGFVPFPDVEACYIGFAWNRTLRNEEEDPRGHILLQQAEFEIEVLGCGMWEWLFAWLSPCHQAAAYPDTITELAMILLGHRKVPAEIVGRLQARLDEGKPKQRNRRPNRDYEIEQLAAQDTLDHLSDPDNPGSDPRLRGIDC